MASTTEEKKLPEHKQELPEDNEKKSTVVKIAAYLQWLKFQRMMRHQLVNIACYVNQTPIIPSTLQNEIPVLTREVPFEHVPELVRNEGSSGGGGSGKFNRRFQRKEYGRHVHVKGEKEIPVLTREVPFEHVPELVRNEGSSGGGGSGKFHRRFLRKEYERHVHVKGEKALLGKTHHQQLFIDEEEERAIKKRMKKAKKRRQMPTLYKENLHDKIADSESSSND